MTMTTPMTESLRAERERPAPPSTSSTTMILVFGHLSWVGWVWILAALGYAVVVTIVALAGGSLDISLWQVAVVGWQRWILFAAGITTVFVFLRLFVVMGVTRARLVSSGLLAMAVVCLLGAVVFGLGFALEQWLYEAQGWDHVLRSEDVYGSSDLPRVVTESAIAFVLTFLSGWLVGAAVYSLGWLGAVLIPFAMLPAASVNLFTSRDFGALNIDVLPVLWDDLALGTTVAISAAIVAVSAAVVRVVTTRLPLHAC